MVTQTELGTMTTIKVSHPFKKLFSLFYLGCLLYTAYRLIWFTPMFIEYWVYFVDIIGLVIIPGCLDCWRGYESEQVIQEKE
jgi:hypothetical protein